MDTQYKWTIVQTLREYGIQPTSQRVEIAHVLFQHRGRVDIEGINQHMSADEVLEQVNADYPRVSKATVYNTIRLLEETGLLKSVVVSASKVFYDPNTHQHHHLYNENTGELVDIPAEQIDMDQLLPLLPEGTSQEDLELVVRIRDRG